MRPRAIAETLVNGNLSDARQAIMRHRDKAPIIALEVVEELVEMMPRIDEGDGSDEPDWWYEAIQRVTRCLNGG